MDAKVAVPVIRQYPQYADCIARFKPQVVQRETVFNKFWPVGIHPAVLGCPYLERSADIINFNGKLPQANQTVAPARRGAWQMDKVDVCRTVYNGHIAGQFRHARSDSRERFGGVARIGAHFVDQYPDTVQFPHIGKGIEFQSHVQVSGIAQYV